MSTATCLCSKCTLAKGALLQDGKCKKCGKRLNAGALLFCVGCARKKGACQRCGKSLKQQAKKKKNAKTK